MKIFRVVIALIITVVLFFIARDTSRGHPETVIGKTPGYTFTMVTTPKAPENDSGRIAVRIEGTIAPDDHVILRTGLTTAAQKAQHNNPHLGMMHFRQDPDTAALWVVYLPVGERGTKEYYFIQIRDSHGNLTSSFARDDGYPFMIKAIGGVPIYVLIGHISMIFATVFCVVMAFFYAIPLIRGSKNVLPMARWYFWAAVFAFLGCYPFGAAMNWFAFGSIWEGVPFGTDATDNKTQLLFIYLLFAFLVSLGSFTREKLGRDLYSLKTLGWIGAIGFAVVWFIYLIPHSIQFSPAFTDLFCYSWIGVIVTLYVAGLVRSRGTDGSSPHLEPGMAGRD